MFSLLNCGKGFEPDVALRHLLRRNDSLPKGEHIRPSDD